MADELPPLIAQLVGDASDLYSTLTQVESVLSTFADKDYTAQLGVDWAPVEAGIQQANAALDAFASDQKNARLGIETTEALEELAAFLAVADSTVITIPVHLDLGGAYAQLASLTAASHLAGGTGSPAGGGGTGGTAGADAATVAALAAATSGGGGGGGGGGNAGLLAALGFSGGGGGGARLAGRWGGILGGLAGIGTLGSLAGGGAESLLTTVAGVAGSGAGALAGGGALALGTAGVTGVGMGTDLAGIGQAAGDIKNVVTAQNALNQAMAVYGPISQQTATAQAQLNAALAGFNPVARSAVLAAANTAQGFKAMFDQVTGQAEKTGAQIINQVMQVAEKFLPTIGKFASENMNIIQASLQPLFTWLQGPGLQIFNQLEAKFQSELPQAMQAFDQGIELLIRTLGFLAPYTGRIIVDLDNLFTRLNGDDWGKYTHAISTAITIFRDWEGLIKAVGTAIYELFTHDAGTGTALVVKLTDLINKFNDWAKTVGGGDQLHALLESHKNELMSIIDVLGHLISSWGQVELVVRPFIMDLVTGLATVLNFLFEIPGAGQLLGIAFAFEILGSRIGFLNGLLSSFNGLIMQLVRGGLLALGGALTSLGGDSGIMATLGGWFTKLGTVAPTEAEAMATSWQLGVDKMIASNEQLIASLGEVDGALATTDAAAGEGGLAAGATKLVGAGGAGAAEDVAGAGAAGAAADVVGAGGAAGLVTLGISTVGIAAIGVVIAAAVLQGLNHPGAGGIGGTATSGQNTGGPNYGTTGGGATGGGAATAPNYGTAPSGSNLGTTGGGGTFGGSPNAPNYGISGVNPAAAMTAAAQAAADYSTNVATLAAATGLSQTAVEGLASSLKINLHSALDPGTVQQFTNYIKANGGVAGVTGAQWTQASENIQAALQAMASKAATAMPNVSGAVRNMVTATQPSLVTLVGNLNKTGDDAGGDFVSAFLAHLSPAQLASKQMHDGVQSPLYPLESELRSIGDTSAANMIAQFIGHKGDAQSKSQQMHDAFKNPLQGLVDDLSVTGDQAGAGLVADFFKHNPDAQTKAGQMELAIHGGFNPLIADLQGIGDAAGAQALAALVGTLDNDAAQANAAGKGVGSQAAAGIAAGITSGQGGISQSVSAVLSTALSGTPILKGGGTSATPHAAGGPVVPGQPYLVGENGPELFMSGFSGAILPINMSSPAIAPVSATNAGGGGNQTITLQAPLQVVLNGQVLATTMQNILLKNGRAVGNLWGGYAGTNATGTSTGINPNAIAR